MVETTIIEAAAEAARWMETATRAVDPDFRGDDATFVRIRDDAPDWVRDVVRAAHFDGKLPDDWTFETTRRALDWIGEGGDPDDSAVFADDVVDSYSQERITWLGSHSSRPAIVDEAQEEYGRSDGIMDAIALGHYVEATIILGAIVEALDARCR